MPPRLPTLALALAVGCGHPPVVGVRDTGAGASKDAGPGTGVALPGAELSEVHWSVRWDPDGLQTADEGAWRILREDGVSFELEEGWLVLYSVGLEPCESSSSRTTPPPHGYADHPSAIPAPVVLALHELTPTALATTRFEVDRFCEVGFSVFRGEPTSPGMPSDPAVQDSSLFVRGRLQRGEDAPWEVFEMASDLSTERDLPLHASAQGSASIALSLRPATLLDGLDLDEPPERLALFSIANLAASATATCSPAR